MGEVLAGDFVPTLKPHPVVIEMALLEVAWADFGDYEKRIAIVLKVQIQQAIVVLINLHLD
ncbi:hypothetical protein AUJ46_02275 [Candidatus Peregrinibacteria bacterium CG1_02_54_53]|nr:MAG: hypothetical protein AUJ46_02275 [Candidatus Peregrinibacteria bacterium CG1_02_54_53]